MDDDWHDGMIERGCVPAPPLVQESLDIMRQKAEQEKQQAANPSMSEGLNWVNLPITSSSTNPSHLSHTAAPGITLQEKRKDSPGKEGDGMKYVGEKRARREIEEQRVDQRVDQEGYQRANDQRVNGRAEQDEQGDAQGDEHGTGFDMRAMDLLSNMLADDGASSVLSEASTLENQAAAKTSGKDSIWSDGDVKAKTIKELFDASDAARVIGLLDAIFNGEKLRMEHIAPAVKMIRDNIFDRLKENKGKGIAFLKHTLDDFQKKLEVRADFIATLHHLKKHMGGEIPPKHKVEIPPKLKGAKKLYDEFEKKYCMNVPLFEEAENAITSGLHRANIMDGLKGAASDQFIMSGNSNSDRKLKATIQNFKKGIQPPFDELYHKHIKDEGEKMTVVKRFVQNLFAGRLGIDMGNISSSTDFVMGLLPFLDEDGDLKQVLTMQVLMASLHNKSEKTNKPHDKVGVGLDGM